MAEFADRIKTLSDAVDKRAAEFESSADAAPVEAGPEVQPPVEAGDHTPLMEVLGLDEETARLMLECAENFEWLKDLSPEDLAKHLNETSSDMQMLMMEVARKQDAAVSETQGALGASQESADVTGPAAI